MSIIRLPMHFEGSQGEKILYCLFDSGAKSSCMSDVAIQNLEKLVKRRKTSEIGTAVAGHYLKITNSTSLDFYYNDIRLSNEFMVIPGLSEEVILGANTFQKWRFKTDFEQDTVIIDTKATEAILN